MNDIGVGDRVVCVDVSINFSDLYPAKPPNLTEGKIYTVRDRSPLGGIYLEEVKSTNYATRSEERGFHLSRFRKCLSTSIEIFTKIDADVFKRVDA